MPSFALRITCELRAAYVTSGPPAFVFVSCRTLQHLREAWTCIYWMCVSARLLLIETSHKREDLYVLQI